MVCPLIRACKYRWFECYDCVLRENCSLFLNKIRFGHENKYYSLQLKSEKGVPAQSLQELPSKPSGEDFIPNMARIRPMKMPFWAGVHFSMLI